MKYITIDLDEPGRWQILKSWHGLRHWHGVNPVGRVSASGNGVHIKSHDVIPAEIGLAEKERRTLGDDPNRIYGDRLNRIQYNQVLYDSKNGKKAGRWTDDVEQLIQWYEKGIKIQ